MLTILVDAAVPRAFARACLEGDEIGRRALAVLDGGVFAPRRALELAEVVVGRLTRVRSALSLSLARFSELRGAPSKAAPHGQDEDAVGLFGKMQVIVRATK